MKSTPALFLKLDAPLVSTQWLEDHLDAPSLRVYDTTVYLKYKEEGFGYCPESGRRDFELAHIPGAGFLDVPGELSDPSAAVPFTMPPADAFAGTMSGHGVADDSAVVLYNRGFPMWSTRVWWMLRSIGFDNVAVLDGGLDKWSRESRPLSDAPSFYPPGSLTARSRAEMWATRNDMLAMIDVGSPVAINCLSPEVYSGAKNRYGRPGHVPRTHNVYYRELLDKNTGEFLPPAALRKLFEACGALDSDRVITYCGGGISATMDSLALLLCGQAQVAVYDGSMSEWVKDDSLPLKLGSQP